MTAQGLVRHTAEVEMILPGLMRDQVAFSAWTAREATRMAWRFVRPRRLDGSIVAFRINHKSEAFVV